MRATLARDAGLARSPWPFAIAGRIALARVRRAGERHVNKALVAFIACLLVGVAAFSASTNLHRFAK